MNKEQLEERVRKLAPWFHRIELGHDVVTKTASVFGEPADHPLSTWEYVQKVLPEDLSGQSVLDIGCNGGFYAAECAKRGAQVLGVESKGHHVAQARLVNEALGLTMRFQKGSLYDLNPTENGQFDLVLSLGVIYHLKHLVAGIERLYLMTRHNLILETAVACQDNIPAIETFQFADNQRRLHPLFFVENEVDSNEAAYNWFVPTASCVQALLRSVGFIEVSEPILFRDRAIITAKKACDFHNSEVSSTLSAKIRPAQPAYQIKNGESLQIQVTAENTGLSRWCKEARPDSGGKGVVRLTAHLLTADGMDFKRDIATAWLAHDIIPGDHATFEIKIPPQKESGQFMLEFDMLSENVIHFEENGSPTAKVQLTVTD